jgi:hypothetical protein
MNASALFVSQMHLILEVVLKKYQRNETFSIDIGNIAASRKIK